MNHHLRMHSGDEKVILVLRPDFPAVCYAEEIELVVRWPDDGRSF
jgi:hypothetical protein